MPGFKSWLYRSFADELGNFFTFCVYSIAMYKKETVIIELILIKLL